MTTIFPTVLIMAIGISVTLMVILVSNAYSEKRSNKLISAFNDAAADFNFSVSEMELVGRRVIGLDEEKNKILFLDRTKKKYDGYLVDLAEIESCTVKKKFDLSGGAYIKRLGVEASVDSVVLRLNYKNGAKPLSLPFYEKSKDPIYDIRIRTDQANEWQLLLSRLVNEDNNEVEGDERNVWYWYNQVVGV